jgi:hypothetical protein
LGSYFLCKGNLQNEPFYDPRIETFISHASEVVNFSASYLQERGWNLIEVQNGEGEISITEQTLKTKLSTWL